ncbi:hypothetical protein GGI17_003015 [Coemansia sp. S146]|nr:hypothetical protein GGI17_003015 [Coemansia sp. S146]
MNSSAPETQRIIVTMKEGLDEKQKVDFIKDFEKSGGKVVDKLDAVNMLIAEAPANVFTNMQKSLDGGHDVVRGVELDGEVTTQK